jgi:hypothetical protein
VNLAAVPAQRRVLAVGLGLAIFAGATITWLGGARDLPASGRFGTPAAAQKLSDARAAVAEPAATPTPPAVVTAQRTPAAAVIAEVQTAPTEVQPTQAAPTSSPTAVATVAVAVPQSATAPPASINPVVASGPHLLLDERFDDNSRGWSNDPEGTAWLGDGAYHLATRQAGQFVSLGAPFPDVLRDVVVNATFHKVSGPAGGGLGIIVRDQGPGPRDGTSQTGRYYVLEVGDRQEVGIWRRETDRWVDLVPWQHADMVRPGTASNDISVRAAGEHLNLLVNGAEAAQANDSTLEAGRVGIFVGGDQNHVLVESYSVFSQT